MLERTRFCDLTRNFALYVDCGPCQKIVMVWATPSEQTILSALEGGRLRCRRCGNPARRASLERKGSHQETLEEWRWP